MTEMAKLTVVSKDSFIGTMPPHLRFDTHPKRGCSLSRYRSFGSVRGGLFAAGSDLVRRIATQAVAIPHQ